MYMVALSLLVDKMEGTRKHLSELSPVLWPLPLSILDDIIGQVEQRQLAACTC